MEVPTAFPNPDIYLNHLPPDEATRSEVARDFYLAILGVAVWDVLVYIPEDFRIVCKGFSPVTFCFIFSRVFAIAYAITYITIQTHAVTNCEVMAIIMSTFCLISMACVSFLFLRRFHAVYAQNRMIQWIFTFLWIGATACGIPAVIDFHMSYTPGTGFCTPYKVREYLSIVDFFPGVFDTLVFLAISYRIMITPGVAGGGTSWGEAVMGKNLPQFSRAVLHSGQQYYLIVFGVTIATGASLYSPSSISTTYHPIFTLSRTILTASMACRAFRNLKTFEIYHQSSSLPVTSPIRFNQPPQSEDTRDRATRMVSQEILQSGSYPVLVISNNSSSLSLDRDDDSLSRWTETEAERVDGVGLAG